MSSEVDKILAESRRSISLARRAGAIAYGLALTVGVLFILRAELVEKFDLPLVFSTDTSPAVFSLSYSLDKGDTWKTPDTAPNAGEYSLTIPADYTADLTVRVTRDIPDSVLDAEMTARAKVSTDDQAGESSDARKLEALPYIVGEQGVEQAAATLKDQLLLPIKKIPCPVEFSADAGVKWQNASKLTDEPPTYSIRPSDYGKTGIFLRAHPATRGQAMTAWVVALALTVPIGLFIAWVVLTLGYMKNVFSIATLIFFTLFGLTMIVPFLWMISTAFKTQQSATLFKIQWIPWPMRWLNFDDVFRTVPFARFYLNSVFLASYVTIGVMFTSALAAYSFARLDFPGRDKLFLAYLGTMMIPGAVTSIPIFVLMCKIGWVDSYKAIIIPGIFSAWGTFMLRQFFMTLPRDLEDAAKIDGCNLFGIFVRIIVPLSKPALATLTIFTFMGSWGDFMWPLIILNDSKKMPLPVGIQFFAASEYPDPNVLMAATMMMIVPVIIVFILGQRYFVEGIQLGAVKG